MSDINSIGFYIAYPTTSILKPIYRGYKTMVNNAHTKVGITENTFEKRMRNYQKTFDNEIVFHPIALYKGEAMEDLKDIENSVMDMLAGHFKKVGQAKEWYDTNDRPLVEKLVHEHLKQFKDIELLASQFNPKQTPPNPVTPISGGHSKDSPLK